MSVFSLKYDAEKVLKLKRKKIGKRSIHDILNDKPIQLDFEEKVNYIRHRFTYYEGNYSLFNDKNGKPNKRKKLLNKIVSEVVLKHKDPSILRKLNKKILIWRKEALEKIKKEKQIEDNKEARDYRLHDWYIRTINSSDSRFHYWKNTIINFINSAENNLEPELLKHIKFKRLKEIVNIWVNKRGMFIDYNKMLLNKYPLEEIIYDEREKNGN